MSEVLVTPAIDIQVVFGGDGSRAFQMRFAPLPLDVGKEQLDEALDRVLAAVDRQRAKYELQDEEIKLQEQIDRIRTYEGLQISIVERHKAEWEREGRKGEWTPDRLPASHKNARDSTEVQLTRERHEAEARSAKIARLRGVLNGHGTHGSADSRPG